MVNISRREALFLLGSGVAAFGCSKGGGGSNSGPTTSDGS